MGRLLIALFLIALAAPSYAQEFATGDVAVAVDIVPRIPVQIEGIVWIFKPDGQRVALPRPADDAFGVVFDPSRRLYAFFSDDPGVNALELWKSPTERLSQIALFAWAPVLDAKGNLYTAGLRKHSPAGVLLRSYARPGNVFGQMDLAADQCTMFFASHTAIRRYDVCAGAPLPDVPVDPSVFQTVPDTTVANEVHSIRILPDGSLIVGTYNGGYHIALTGNVLRHYTIPGLSDFWPVIALDPSGTQLWVGKDIGELYRIDLATGNVVAGPFDIVRYPNSMSVAGEPRAALAAVTQVPAMSPSLLAALACVLGVIALHRLRGA